LKALATLVVLARRVRPDVCLAYTIKPVIWGLLAAGLAGVRRRVALITGLGYAFTGEARGKRALVQWVARWLYARALRRATLVFFQNPDDRDDFVKLGLVAQSVPMVVLRGSGVDVEAFTPAALPDGPVQFLLIARLLGDKGIREYARAAAIVRQRHPEARFHLVGGLDPNPDALSENEVRGWVAAGDIIWHGALEDVRPAIAASHVYVLPSYREGTPRTVLEAMAMGRPIITTDAPGCRETVRPGVTGFLVPVRDAPSLAEAMERYLDTPELIGPMGSAARNLVVEKYDVRKVNDRMLGAMGL
jgi:glycosyltransferase involved in cell wall biosynthesis